MILCTLKYASQTHTHTKDRLTQTSFRQYKTVNFIVHTNNLMNDEDEISFLYHIKQFYLLMPSHNLFSRLGSFPEAGEHAARSGGIIGRKQYRGTV